MPDVGQLLPDYKSPPINEVVWGLTIEPITELLLPHIGLFWSKIRDKYPLCEQAAPVMRPTQDPSWIDRASGLILPRIYLLGQSRNELIQLQNDRFHFNWRQVEGAPVPYPHFDYIRDRYSSAYQAWSEFVRTELGREIAPTVFELSYVNVIPKGTGWNTFAEFSHVIPDLDFMGGERFLPMPDKMAWQATFTMPEQQGSLNVRVGPGLRVTDNTDVLRWELSATADAKNVNDASVWFDLAHRWIVLAFADLASEDLQVQTWQRVERLS